jgi:anthranilate synthase component 2
MKTILVLDNYDSFTYNLVHAIESAVDCRVEVFRNDAISLAEVDRYHEIVLSPGPGIPDESGILKDLIAQYAPTKKILGVCLGQQAMGEVFGGKLINLEQVYHGVATEVEIVDRKDPLFLNLPARFKIGRYHSWIVEKESMPDALKITAIDGSGQVMALRHKEYNVCGVQFHPESILTEYGQKIIMNWLNS